MPWDHEKYEEAYAVFLSSGEDGGKPPDAIFSSRAEALEWLVRQREKAQREDDLEHRRAAMTYYRHASVLTVRNCFIPYWNDGDPLPEDVPCPVPVEERNELAEQVGRENDRLRGVADRIINAVVRAARKAADIPE